MEKKKIVILGGSGSIGSAIAKEVYKEGYIPHIISRNELVLKDISKKIDCPYSVADVLDPDNLRNCLENINENVFGLAYCVGQLILNLYYHQLKKNILIVID